MWPVLRKGVLYIVDWPHANSIYLESCNLTYEFGTTLKLDLSIYTTNIAVSYEGESFKLEEIWFTKVENLEKL